MKIQWNKVTWYSKLIAVLLFLAIFVLGLYLGAALQKNKDNVAFYNYVSGSLLK